ncbi:signaling lymphocytic activation molecule isoform X1 [Molossus molossus]|uniref:Signaling lymphocytic activation molecule family member 1 n=1 Tax=Molossus molossus TaxID=27622 RepID=A0A7J8CU05_MOLMO|nr:signaling lymphocytic activation molecule isoform X1 [Molossus molossus]KAF6414358.1 signaling lymphocytic activation molecule family member 1 [Molossus molossus]
MHPKGLLSWNFLLFLSLAFERSCKTGEGLMNCPTIPGQLGSKVLLPLTSEGISKSTNKSIHIFVTMTKSPGNGSQKNKKIVSLDLPEGGIPRYSEGGYMFYLENLNLEIAESKKEHEGQYTLTMEENDSVQNFCLQLKLYEQVTTPEIKVLNWTQENGNCNLTLACMVKQGDHVAYSWSKKSDNYPLSTANDSHILQLTLGPQDADNIYICIASNPISSHFQTFEPVSTCGSYSPVPRKWGLYAGLFLGGIIGVILILQVVILLLRRRGKADQYQPTVDEKSLTIYAQIEKSGSVQKKPDPLPAQDPCTTIYVAATEPVTKPVQEPSSTTVYASVTLPES